MPTSDPRTTGLLILDYQTGYFRSCPGAERLYVPGFEPLLPLLATAKKAAKALGVRVYYVNVEFGPGYKEVGERSYAGFQMVRDNRLFLEGNLETPVHPDVAPDDEDVVIQKHRVGAFIGTELDRILRGHRIETIAIAGLATRGAVLSTMRQASDLDYGITILEDVCGDHDEEVQQVLMRKIFPSQADVITTDQWLASLGA